MDRAQYRVSAVQRSYRWTENSRRADCLRVHGRPAYPRRDKDLTSHEGVLGPLGNMDLTSQEGVLGPPSCCQPNHSALITDRNQTDYDVTDSGGQTDKR